METLELISINVWHIVAAIGNLLILTLILKKFLFQPVQRIFAERQAEVDGMYRQAEEAAKTAEDSRLMYEEKLHNADLEAENIVKSAASRGERIGEEIVADAKKKADRMIAVAEADIARSRKKAVNDMKDEIAGISVQIAEQVVEREISGDDHSRLIDAFIDGIGDGQ